MSQDIRSQLETLVKAALASVAPGAQVPALLFERPKQAAHGDFSCNVAMQIAKALRRNPRELATLLCAEIPPSPLIRKVEVAGGGFINFHLFPAARLAAVGQALSLGAAYGRSDAGRGTPVQVEFVSANPTGPLHVGHGRGAAYGASLASVLVFAGFDVTREYYVNDAGRQMDILAVSTWLRYLDQLGETVPFPPNGYQGDYVRDMARKFAVMHGDRCLRMASEVLAGTPGLPPPERTDDEAKQQRENHLDALIAAGKRLLGKDWPFVHGFVLNEQMADLRDDLEGFGVDFDVWFSEQSLYDTGLVERAVKKLEEAGHIYTQNRSKWFRSTAFGDEKDRCVQRENGLYTYFASDIAYHLNKFERGFKLIIDVWGADHHGYIPRVRGAMQALDLDAGQLTVALVQFAVLYRNGQKASMSTRSGEFVTLRELREEVGNDACRFFYVLRKSDQHLDFDLDLAKSQSNENPVYYIQYAHARVCSMLSQWGGDEATLSNVDLSPLESEREFALATRLGSFPDVIAAAAGDLAPHSVAFYLRDLAADFHTWYNAERVLIDDEALKNARLALAAATRQVIRNGLGLLGVSCPETM